jgi:hypothetical protein
MNSKEIETENNSKKTRVSQTKEGTLKMPIPTVSNGQVQETGGEGDTVNNPAVSQTKEGTLEMPIPTVSNRQVQETEETEDKGDIANNRRIIQLMNENKMEEAVNQMFVRPGDGSRMSYSEMRSYYG